MPRRELVVILEDVLGAIGEAEALLLHVQDFDEFAASRLHQRALERLLEIIGESLSQAKKLKVELPITDLSKIIGLRHIIAHDYYDVSTDRIWIIATGKLGVLKQEIEQIIGQENQKLFGTSSPNFEE